MKRLAIGLSAWLLSGCIFLTPPTGLRIGDHSQEFAHLQGQSTAADPVTSKLLTHEAPDFSVSYPEGWGTGKADNNMEGTFTSRLTAGLQDMKGQREGLIVTTVNQGLGKDAAQDAVNLAILTKGDLTKQFKSFTVVSEEAKTLGGNPAIRMEAKGIDSLDNESHMVAYSSARGARGWIAVIFTIESRYASLAPIIEGVFQSFTFKDGAVSAPSVAPTGPAGSPGPQPSEGSPSASPSPTPTPSGAPNVPPQAPSPNASQPASPTP